jgi:clan AA aspartic protease (TIGR02281 family)
MKLPICVDPPSGTGQVVVTVIVGLLLATPASAHCRLLQVAELPVDAAHNRPLIAGQINGQAVKILVDTGSQTSVVTRSTANRLGLKQVSSSSTSRGVGGEVKEYNTSLKQLTLDKFTVHDLAMPVAVEGERNFDMILGENFFAQFTVEFDLAHGAIRLFKPKGCRADQLAYWSQTYSLADLASSPTDSLRIETTVSLNGRALRAILDTGATLSTVSRTATVGLGISIDENSHTHAMGIGRDAVDSWVGKFEKFTVGDETIQNVSLFIVDTTKHNELMTTRSRIPETYELPHMLIGADFFLAHRVLIYGADRKMVFTYLGGPVFDANQLHRNAEASSNSQEPNSAEPTPKEPR